MNHTRSASILLHTRMWLNALNEIHQGKEKTTNKNKKLPTLDVVICKPVYANYFQAVCVGLARLTQLGQLYRVPSGLSTHHLPKTQNRIIS